MISPVLSGLIIRGQSASSSLVTRPMISSGRGRLIVGSLPGPSSLPLPPDDQLGTSEASSAGQWLRWAPHSFRTISPRAVELIVRQVRDRRDPDRVHPVPGSQTLAACPPTPAPVACLPPIRRAGRIPSWEETTPTAEPLMPSRCVPTVGAKVPTVGTPRTVRSGRGRAR